MRLNSLTTSAVDLLLVGLRFAFGRRSFRSSGLGGCRFHGLAVFFRTLGTRFVAFHALLVERSFATQQLHEGDVAAITLAEAAMDDSEIAAVAVAVARRNRVKQLVDRFARHQVGQSLPTGRHVSALAQG